jgi:hypothetical protein
MFTESCKRLRIMKSSEAIGLGKTNVCYIKISCMIPSYFLTDSCILLFLQHLEPWRNVKVATSAMQCASCILICKDRRSHLLSIKYLLALAYVCIKSILYTRMEPHTPKLYSRPSILMTIY